MKRTVVENGPSSPPKYKVWKEKKIIIRSKYQNIELNPDSNLKLHFFQFFFKIFDFSSTPSSFNVRPYLETIKFSVETPFHEK